MWPQFSNMLSPWHWLVLGLVPPLIVLLYFLKLKRQPLEVPSTYLWLKSIEDLHVNSIWQRLRKNLLLFLQLLLVALVMLALLRLSWQGSRLSGKRHIFLIDTSASMAAEDVAPTRLDEAKRLAGDLIDEMESGDVAMLISFSDSARVEQSFTDNRNELRRRLNAIKQTDRTTSIAEALRVASGLANPGRSAADTTDFQVAEARPASMYLLSDGNFPDVRDFSQGHLTTRYVPIGTPEAHNVAVAAFNTGHEEDHPEHMQAFGRIVNHGPRGVSLDVELLLDGELVDAQRVKAPKGESTGLAFDLEDVQLGVLEMRIKGNDELAIDNAAWTAINPPRSSRVLFVTPGNEPVSLALDTDRARELAEVTTRSPEFLETPEYQGPADAGAWDLIVFDRCRPKQMPQANTLFIGRLPVTDAWKADKKVDIPQIIDTQRSHPLMHLVELGDVLILEATPLFPPPGSTVLIDTNAGPVFAIGPRLGFEDAVLGLEVVGENRRMGTNWPVRFSFPVFVLSCLEYLGGHRSAAETGSVVPGQTVVWRSQAGLESIRVKTPKNATVEVSRVQVGVYPFTQTSDVGIYEVLENKVTSGKFAVNLFNRMESSLAPRPDVTLGDTKVVAEATWEPAKRDGWKWFVLAALAVLLFEWYIYNQRIYI